MRYDNQLILNWITPQMRVLDLGCGDGELLHYLKQNNIHSLYGIDQNLKKVQSCLKKGISSIQADIEGRFLDTLEPQSFDVIILGLTLYALDKPELFLTKILSIGKNVIVSFVNYSHYSVRLPFLFNGTLKAQNIDNQNTRTHMLTIQLFEATCQKLSINILEKVFLNHQQRKSLLAKRVPNWFCHTALYQLTKS